MSGIKRFLPNNEYLAAVNSPTQATQVNPFATIADLPAPTGDGIYTGSGSLSGSTVVTHGVNQLQFLLSDSAGHFFVAPAPWTAAASIHLQAFDTNGTFIRGSSNTSGNTLTLQNAVGGITSARFENAGNVRLGVDNTSVIRGQVSIGTLVSDVNTKLTVRGRNTSSAEVAMYVGGSSGTAGLHISNDERIGIGILPVAGTKLNVNAGTGFSKILNLEAAPSNANRFEVFDNGRISTGVGQTSTGATNTGQMHRISAHAIGVNFVPNGATSAGVQIQAAGNTPTSLNIIPQGVSSTGVIRGISVDHKATSGTEHTAAYFFARNGSLRTLGIDARVGGGSGTASSQFVKAVAGLALDNLDTLQYGGDFGAQYNNAATVYTKDIHGVNAYANGTSGNASSTGKVVAAKFSTSGIAGTGDRLAIWVPSTGNNGNSIFKQDDSTGNGYSIEVTGGIEFNGDGTGFRMYQPNGVAREVTLNNSGAFVIT